MTPRELAELAMLTSENFKRIQVTSVEVVYEDKEYNLSVFEVASNGDAFVPYFVRNVVTDEELNVRSMRDVKDAMKRLHKMEHEQ